LLEILLSKLAKDLTLGLDAISPATLGNGITILNGDSTVFPIEKCKFT
jgi:hypothetical protein